MSDHQAHSNGGLASTLTSGLGRQIGSGVPARRLVTPPMANGMAPAYDQTGLGIAPDGTYAGYAQLPSPD